ncbi:MAG TPA: hypothetical protein VMW31_04110, partial [Devosiaceae bacterium]|nr:hypothetical protein [Devosiaceae bacterium]
MAQANSAVVAAADAGEIRQRRPIDLVHLARQAMGDHSLEIEILRMFDEQVRDQMVRLRTTGDSGERLLLLHAIKGTAFGVGALMVGQLAANGEAQQRRDGEVAAEVIADLDLAVAEARA